MSTLKFDENRLMQVLVAPIISEKATAAAEERGQVLFKVLRDATSPRSRPLLSCCSRSKWNPCKS